MLVFLHLVECGIEGHHVAPLCVLRFVAGPSARFSGNFILNRASCWSLYCWCPQFRLGKPFMPFPFPIQQIPEECGGADLIQMNMMTDVLSSISWANLFPNPTTWHQGNTGGGTWWVTSWWEGTWWPCGRIRYAKRTDPSTRCRAGSEWRHWSLYWILYAPSSGDELIYEWRRDNIRGSRQAKKTILLLGMTSLSDASLSKRLCIQPLWQPTKCFKAWSCCWMQVSTNCGIAYGSMH